MMFAKKHPYKAKLLNSMGNEQMTIKLYTIKNLDWTSNSVLKRLGIFLTTRRADIYRSTFVIMMGMDGVVVITFLSMQPNQTTTTCHVNTALH